MANQNIYALFQSRFPADRDRPVIETPAGDVFSYGDLERESARYARLLTDQGVRPGDRVAVQVDKSPQALFLYLGCLRGGFIYLPLNTGYTAKELDYFLHDAEPAAVICRPDDLDRVTAQARNRGVARVYSLDGRAGTLNGLAESVEPHFDVVPRQGDEVAVILYTSGTTGRPKGAMIGHAGLAANSLTLHAAWGWQAGDVLLHVLPIFHIHGLFIACHCALLNGSKMIFMPRFDTAETVRQLPRATVLMGVPTVYTRLLAEPDFDADACRNMRLFVSGSAPLLEQTFNEFHTRTGHTILERYGMTETGMNTSNPLHGERLPGTVGPALPGVDVRIVDARDRPLAPGEAGQLQVRGPNVFLGYWRMPDKTAAEFTADGFFRTGDIAIQNPLGYLSIVGRAKDMVISGGYNVYPKEIEGVIDTLPGVLESAVIGVPHPDFGEAVVAVIASDDRDALPSEADMIAGLKTELAGYKVPKRIHVVDTLPRNTMGKVQKNVLRERYAGTFTT